MEADNQKVIMGFAYEYTFQDHEYIIRTVNTKHEGANIYNCLSFLLQAAPKIAISCPKYIYVSCSGNAIKLMN